MQNKMTQTQQATFFHPRKKRHRSQEEFVYHQNSLWNQDSQRQEIINAVKKSQIFSPLRTQTFVKFNYRHCDTKSINYNTAFQKVLAHKKGRDRAKIKHGSMHISDLWCQKNMQQVMGNLPLPNDRFKLLDAYKNGKLMKLKPIKRKKGKQN